MQRRTWLVPLLGWCVAVPALANGLYRWVDATGHVVYGDAPSPGAHRVQQLRPASGMAMETGAAPSLASVRAVRASSVTTLPPDVTLVLFVTDCGEVCRLAKGFMDERGLPYREIDPRSDDASRDAFLKASPNSVVPTLLIQKANGETTAVNGYNSNQWYESLKKVGAVFPTPGKMVVPAGASQAASGASMRPSIAGQVGAGDPAPPFNR